jgi:hypothetical protein
MQWQCMLALPLCGALSFPAYDKANRQARGREGGIWLAYCDSCKSSVATGLVISMGTVLFARPGDMNKLSNASFCVPVADQALG